MDLQAANLCQQTSQKLTSTNVNFLPNGTDATPILHLNKLSYLSLTIIGFRFNEVKKKNITMLHFFTVDYGGSVETYVLPK